MLTRTCSAKLRNCGVYFPATLRFGRRPVNIPVALHHHGSVIISSSTIVVIVSTGGRRHKSTPPDVSNWCCQQTTVQSKASSRHLPRLYPRHQSPPDVTIDVTIHHLSLFSLLSPSSFVTYSPPHVAIRHRNQILAPKVTINFIIGVIIHNIRRRRQALWPQSSPLDVTVWRRSRHRHQTSPPDVTNARHR